MGSSLTRKLRKTAGICALLVLTVCLAAASPAQEKQQAQQQGPQIAPPPMRSIPLDEWTKLTNARNSGERTRDCIEFAEEHLRRAQELTTKGQYDDAASEMGSYQALFEDTLRHLGGVDQNRGKLRDHYKRLELALREQAPRIETIRRVTPVEYAVHIRAILEYNKAARTRALDSFYGNTVLREQPLPPSTKSYGNNAQTPASHSSPAPDKQP
jgi:hypothetical protein